MINKEYHGIIEDRNLSIKLRDDISSNQKDKKFGADESNSRRNEVFKEVIRLINKGRNYMLGPEKSITAKFIAENTTDIFQLLNSVLKIKENERKE